MCKLSTFGFYVAQKTTCNTIHLASSKRIIAINQSSFSNPNREWRDYTNNFYLQCSLHLQSHTKITNLHNTSISKKKFNQSLCNASTLTQKKKNFPNSKIYQIAFAYQYSIKHKIYITMRKNINTSSHTHINTSALQHRTAYTILNTTILFVYEFTNGIKVMLSKRIHMWIRPTLNDVCNIVVPKQQNRYVIGMWHKCQGGDTHIDSIIKRLGTKHTLKEENGIIWKGFESFMWTYVLELIFFYPQCHLCFDKWLLFALIEFVTIYKTLKLKVGKIYPKLLAIFFLMVIYAQFCNFFHHIKSIMWCIPIWNQ